MRSDDRDRDHASRGPELKPAEPEVAPAAPPRDTREELAELLGLMAALADQVPGAHGLAAQFRRLKASLG